MVFDPVLYLIPCLIPFEDEDEAVRIANDSPYGLAAGVWCGDPAQASGCPSRSR